MKIQALKSDFANALQLATIGISSGDGEHWKYHYIFRFSDSKLELLSSNDARLSVATPVKATVTNMEEGAAFTVPGWRLRQFISALDEDEMITLEHTTGVTKASAGGKSPGRFPSLDPKDFPFWDQMFKNAPSVGKIDGERFSKALAFSRNFISENESKSAALVAAQCREGTLNATDSVAVSLVTIKGLENSKMQLHGKDVGAVLSFLALKGSEEVEIFENDRCLFLQRTDGALLGVARWVYELPPIKINKDEVEKCWFSVAKEDLLRGIKCLGAFAQKDYDKLSFNFDSGNIILSAESGSGSGGKESLSIPCIEHSSMDKLALVKPDGFSLTKDYVEIIAAQSGSKDLRFGVSWTEKKNGYIRFRMDRDGDDYLAVVTWRK